MTGWRWCQGARGRCCRCGAMVEGLWRYFAQQGQSHMDVCAECAEHAR